MIHKLYVRFVVVGVTLLSAGNLIAEQNDVNTDVNDVLNASLDSINETYQGQHSYFDDDMVGNFFSNIGELLVKHVINPFIKGIGAGDPLCLIGAAILVVVAIGFFHRMGGRIFDSLVGRPKSSGTETAKKA